MQLTNPERKAIAEVTQLKEYINGLERANTIYSESIQSIIGSDAQTTVELSPNLLALMKEVFKMIQNESQQQGEKNE